jgi:hypothetical protein
MDLFVCPGVAISTFLGSLRQRLARVRLPVIDSRFFGELESRFNMTSVPFVAGIADHILRRTIARAILTDDACPGEACPRAKRQRNLLGHASAR